MPGQSIYALLGMRCILHHRRMENIAWLVTVNMPRFDIKLRALYQVLIEV